jgi:DUF1365 family protein
MNSPPAAEPARPSLLLGRVYHRRLRPARNAFSYHVYALRLPLRTLSTQAHWGNRWLSHNRFNLLSFYDRDYGDGTGKPLDWVQRVLDAHGIGDADGEIWLQTFPRVLGYVFNPVSFWFCERADGSLRAVLCEVNNTFGERHCYLLDAGRPLRNGETITAQKTFHVSPFCQVAGSYRFRFMNGLAADARPDESADCSTNPFASIARIDYCDADGPLLLTSIATTAWPLESRRTLWAFLRYPMMTVGVVVRIHWQALKLFAKRVPLLRKPAPPAAPVTHARAEEPY